MARKDKAGVTRRGKVRHGQYRQGKARQAWQVAAGTGGDGHGAAGKEVTGKLVSQNNYRQHSGASKMAKATAATAAKPEASTVVTIKPANIQTAKFKIVGTAPLVQARFSAKTAQAMMAKMALGSAANKSRAKPARDFDDDMEQAKHVSEEGWQGIPAAAFRNAMISACRLVGFKMVLAKLSVFVEADGIDRVDGIPLIKFEGTPERHEMAARVGIDGTDIRIRPMWRRWSATVRVRYDADQFTLEDVANLMQRVGMQVGIGEGRPDSRSSAGMGWGTFEIAG